MDEDFQYVVMGTSSNRDLQGFQHEGNGKKVNSKGKGKKVTRDSNGDSDNNSDGDSNGCIFT